MLSPRPLFVARAAIALFVAAAGAACASARGTGAPASSTHPLDIRYTVAVRAPASHYYDIELDVGALAGDTLLLQMPVWSPGRYARMDFARTVIAPHAETSDGAPLALEPVNGSLWRIDARGAKGVRVTYRVFANTLSGTFSVVDTAHANWNGASLFMYVVGHKPDPVRLHVEAPAGWRLMNGVATSETQRDFSFPNYDILIDTPTEIAPAFDVDSFRVDDRLYRVMVHHDGPEQGQRERFVRDVERIVRYENGVLGPPPLRTYTFLFNIGYDGADGMEHLVSTQIQTRERWSPGVAILPGVSEAAHEYFHVWNVKRIRPAALGPIEYTTEQYQPRLWVAEGWTQYYGEIALVRAGLEDRGAYYRTLAGVIDYNRTVPARRWQSVRLASIDAPFWDGAATPMASDRGESFVNYYFKGEALALLLDIEIRARSAGARSLDDALRALAHRSWDAPRASYYLSGRGYTEQDVEDAVSEAAGTNLHAWFERYVGGTAELPFDETLALVGLRARTDSGAVVLEEDPQATPEQRARRDAWLAGRTEQRQ